MPVGGKLEQSEWRSLVRTPERDLVSAFRAVTEEDRPIFANLRAFVAHLARRIDRTVLFTCIAEHAVVPSIHDACLLAVAVLATDDAEFAHANWLVRCRLSMR